MFLYMYTNIHLNDKDLLNDNKIIRHLLHKTDKMNNEDFTKYI